MGGPPSPISDHSGPQSMLSIAQTYVVFLACALLVFGPIISVQISRFSRIKNNTNDASNKPMRRHRPPMLDGSDADPQPSRRPWDPPFPSTTSNTTKASSWRILQPTAPRRTDTTIDDGNGSADEPKQKQTATDIATSKDSPQPVDAEQPPKNEHMKEKSGGMTILWAILAAFAGLSMFLLFAVITAHCLAWFIVYKTEARLGEARRGLVQGGEMRLCLCARG